MSQDSGDFFKGFIFGGLVGAIVGILFAPKSGRETREELALKADELISKAKEELEKHQEDYEKALGKIEEVGSAVKESVLGAGEKITEAVHSGKETAEDKKRG
ncbi:MAG: YtxH domain-containing protein [Smithellaceae bacterium]